jgi:hypothetical protein
MRYVNYFFNKISKNSRVLLFLLVLCVLLFVIKLLFVSNIEALNNNNNKYDNYHIVCAKYKKNVDFLKDIDISYSVMEKGIDVPNVANEASSYLFYIIENYDNLPENIIFIHDENESWHHDGKITDNIYKWIDEYEKKGKTYYEFNNMIINKNGENMPKDLYNTNVAYKNFWDNVMRNYIGEYETCTPEKGTCCAQYIISRNNILDKPKKFYEDFYNWLIDNTNGEGNGDSNDIYSGNMTGRYAEWSWRFIFNEQ